MAVVGFSTAMITDKTIRVPFDTLYYLKATSCDDHPQLSPSQHYFKYGWRELHDPAPNFSTIFYILNEPQVLSTESNPEKRFPEEIPFFEQPRTREELAYCRLAKQLVLSDLFDYDWYLRSNPDLVKAGVNPLRHFLEYGIGEHRDPGPNFNSEWYRLRYCDYEPPVLHYLNLLTIVGLKQLPSCFPVGQEAQLFKKLQTVEKSGCGDSGWYAREYPEVDLKEITAVAHYLTMGWKMGYNPFPGFETNWYLLRNPGLAAADRNPLMHYLLWGKREGRLAAPVADEVIGFPSGHPATEQQYLNAVSTLPGIGGVRTVSQRVAIHKVFESKTANWSTKSLGAYRLRQFDEPIAVVGGAHFLLGENNRLYSDELHDTLGDERLGSKCRRVSWDGSKSSPKKAHILYERRPNLYLECGLHCMHEYDQNYFHYLVEVLTKLPLATALGVPHEIPIVISAKQHSNFRKLLSLVNVEERPIIEVPRGVACRVDRLAYIEPTAKILDVYKGTMNREDMAIGKAPLVSLQKILLSQLRLEPASPFEKIFIRRGDRLRRIVNESALELFLTERGFAAISPESLTIERQAELFSNAKVVVSSTGAALANLIWCQPETQVVVLRSNHPNINLFFWDDICDYFGLKKYEIEGQRLFNQVGLHSVHDDYHIEVSELKNLLQEIGELA